MIYTKVDETVVTKDNPLVMYIIINEELGMSPGKLAAQVGHGIQLIMQDYYELDNFSQRSPSAAMSLFDEEINIIQRMDLWLHTEMENKYTKVTLRADKKEFEKIKAEFGKNLALVIDAGKTEIPAGSETVIILYPLFKNENKTIKRLQTLK